MKNIIVVAFCICAVSLFMILGFQNSVASIFVDCEKMVTNLPKTYSKGSELYYLSWIEHGEYSEKVASAKKYFEFSNKKESKIAEQLCVCEKDQVTKNYLTLSLFELEPEKFLKQTQSLLTEKDSSGLQPNIEATWVKAGKFEDKDVDFYFDWGKEAALLLLSKGDFSEKGVEILIQTANSFYSAEREDAAKIFALFEGIPKILLKQRERYDGENPFKDELNAVENWFAKNKGNIRWDAKKQKYFIN